MNIKAKAHYQAALELLEVMSIASLIALIADAIWIIRDISVNGLTLGLGIVGVLLWIALIIMGYGVYKYHVKAVKKILHEMMEQKVKINKSRRKAKARGVL